MRGTTRNERIEKHIGARIKKIRQQRQLSQTDLGDRFGITFQQIQKYEKGTNRVSASLLWRMSRFLQVPVDYFFAAR